jgi:hypothetical protein
VLFSLGVAAEEALVDFAPELVPGCAIPPAGGPPLTGGVCANAAEAVPIARMTTEKAIGNFIGGEELQRHNVKINGFVVR